jgi:pentapeptide repeat protein
VGRFEPDCAHCVGLCCVALPFSRSTGSAGFAFDKPAGEPCRHLAVDDRCAIHSSLLPEGMGGCVAYECYGAGQHVSQVLYDGVSWREAPGIAGQMFAVLAVVRRLHEMLVLLDQASSRAPSTTLAALRDRVSAATLGTPAEVLDVELDRLAARVGDALGAVSREVRGAGPSYAGQDLVGRDLRDVPLARADLRGALLIAADLSDTDLDRTDLLGADLRDADLSGADLSTALFLTQPQLNGARGDAATVLPARLRRPHGWLPA